ncbi:MAG: hypothetical protein ABI921_05535 [Panacibacter sp.]
MIKHLLIILFFFIGLSCNSFNTDNELIEGDLYFDWFRIGSFYNQPDSVIRNAKNYFDTVNQYNLDSSDKRIFDMYESLKKENLLYSPFIDMKLDNDSIMKIYFKNADYEKIKIYSRKELQDTKKKIRLKLEVRELGNKMAFCTKLVSVNKVNGQTFMISRKFKIEDYK